MLRTLPVEVIGVSSPLGIPTLLEEITPEWLTAALAQGGHLPRGKVSAVHAERFGEGVGLMGQTARLRAEYEGAPKGTRTHFVVKMPAPPGPNRQMGIDYRIYEKEVWFYERLAGRVPLRTPAVFYSVFNPENHDFVLLLEDLSPAVVGSELTPPTDDQVRLALRELAGFHAHWWASPELETLDWIPYLNSDIYRQHVAFYAYAWPMWKEKFGSTASEYVLKSGERLGQRIAEMQDLLCQPPLTIMHMDFRLPNLFFKGPQGGVEFAVIDWQPFARCRGLYDVGYFMAQSLPTERRRRLEDEVLHLYYETLRENGVSGYSYDDCFRDYRLGAMYTFLYPVGTTAIDLANETGQLYQKTITERHSAAIEDLRAGDVIPD